MTPSSVTQLGAKQAAMTPRDTTQPAAPQPARPESGPIDLSQLRVARADYHDPATARVVVDLLDAYARDAAGGGAPLSDFARANLVPGLAAQVGAFSLIAWLRDADGREQPVGLANCFVGFSTFAARPLVNVHDLVVVEACRGQRVGARLLEAVEAEARERGACKLTLEVLTGNQRAMALYRRQGFEGYVLDPALGQATFMHKRLG